MNHHCSYTQKYLPKWEREPNFKDWLQLSSDQVNAYCLACKKNFRLHHTDLLKHSKTPSHEAKMRSLKPQENNQYCLSNFGISSVSKETKSAELHLALFIACHSAIHTVDHLIPVIKKQFQSSGWDNVSLHRTKCSALIANVIAPSLLHELLTDLDGEYFSLLFDESTDISTVKYLCIVVRYFSKKEQSIVSTFLALLQVNETTADSLFNTILKFLNKLGINIKKLIAIGVDGASNMCGCNNSLFTKLRDINSKLILVKCVCHSLALCCSKAANTLPSNLEFILRETYKWFSLSSRRKHDYKTVFDIISPGDEKHEFIQLAATRWLSRAKALRIILDQWFQLRALFNSVAERERCYSGRMLRDMYNDDVNRLYFIFLRPILDEFNRLNLLFQNEEIDHFLLLTELKSFTLALISRIVKNGFVKLDVNLNDENNFLPLGNIDFGYEFTKELQKMCLEFQNHHAHIIKERCKNFILEAAQQLLNRFPPNFELLKSIENLTPVKILNHFRTQFQDLPLNLIDISDLDISKLENQWRIILECDWKSYFKGKIPENNSVNFWAGVLAYRNAGNQQIFLELATFALRILTLPLSNADVERIFSLMNLIKSPVRNKMQLKMLSSLIRIRNMYKANECCINFKPNELMFCKFNNSMYFSNEEMDQLNDFEL